MPTFRNFFPAVQMQYRLFVFGGYDGNLKNQIDLCEYYDFKQEKWVQIPCLKVARSQSAACKINDREILVCGGYNKEKGILDSIEKFNVAENRFELVDMKMPIPLRRFTVVRIKQNLALILGGLTKASKENQRVFKLDFEKREISELEGLEKGGVIENEVLVDHEGFLHIFLEHSNGTSPHSHIKYLFDPNADKY